MQFKFALLILTIICSSFAQELLDNSIDKSNNDTTTPPPTTTSTTTPATTTTAPTTTAAPAVTFTYNVTDKNTNITCIMLDGDITFKVTYNIGGNSTNTTSVSVPKPSNKVRVNGNCNAGEGYQFISIEWGKPVLSSGLKIYFSLAKDDKLWSIKNLTSRIYMDESIFLNATSAGDSLKSEVHLGSFTDIPVNHSFKCISSLVFDNITTTMEMKEYEYPLVLTFDGVQIEAFNEIASQNSFASEIHCDADKIADIVPIAVGIALAILIVIVLIAYIIARRKRSAAYQSV